MAVTKRGDRWYVAFRYNDPITGEPKRFRRTTGAGATKADAKQLEAEWRLEMTSPPAPAAPEVKSAAFSGFAHHWHQVHVLANCKPSTQRSYHTVMRMHLVPHFGDRDLRTIDAEAIEAFKAAQLKAGSKPKSVNNRLGVLGRLFHDAHRWKYCEHNPCEDVQPVSTGIKTFRFWTREQSDRFLKAIEEAEPRWHALFAVALLSGLRQGEILGLDWDAVDLTAGILYVRQSWTEGKLGTPKSGLNREVPMPSRLADILRRHPRRIDTDIVFPRAEPHEGTLRLSQPCLWKPFHRGVRRAGIPKIGFHDLRHSYASQLVMAGVPLKAVQEYLGHADLTTTMRYAHLSPTARASYVEVLSEPSGPKMAPNRQENG